MPAGRLNETDWPLERSAPPFNGGFEVQNPGKISFPQLFFTVNSTSPSLVLDLAVNADFTMIFDLA